MANSRIPDPLERRHLIERELPSARALEIAEGYLEEERAAEAVVFLAKAGAEDRLHALAETAIAEGDVFLLTEIARVRGVDPEPEAWERLAEAARRAGKDAYAETALRQAHRGEA